MCWTHICIFLWGNLLKVLESGFWGLLVLKRMAVCGISKKGTRTKLDAKEPHPPSPIVNNHHYYLMYFFVSHCQKQSWKKKKNN
jgi:hypothetical protein